VSANRKVQIEWHIAQPSRAKPFIVTGCLVPPLANVPITIEVIDPQGKVHLLYTHTNANGCFQTDQVLGGEPYFPQQNGQYKVQVFVTAGGDAAEMESEISSVTLTG
jgi:hypothetical protein